MATSKTIPDGYLDLLERPIVGSLATVRIDGAPTATPMWFQWDGELIRFTHTGARQKTKNLEAEPRFSFVIIDPEDPYRYLEIRGELESIEPDPTGAFYVVLGQRYGNAEQEPPADSPDRVVIALRPEVYNTH
ncbi:PPOX class F420-dependent oxidoreductase [Amnibacterium flavum]|uniref:F420-dependent protein n=1 Tax=Amnibacterium flavum TaxID=2173173 RepID=A0A2V1HZA0_9MICO|nr:PPOX class F420-dependent oxidoreductase [Amnibacterium flavum]PVZ96014.1 F420-dependent protein [Amnibacterium flavum]